MKKLTVLLVVAVMVFALFAGCEAPESPATEGGTSGGEAASGDLPVFKVAVLAGIHSATIYYADEMGWDIEAGFDMQLQEFSSGGPMNEAFAAGELDGADMGPAGVHALGQFDAKVVGASAQQRSVELLVNPDDEILSVQGWNPDYPDVYGSPEAIKGKTILLPTGTYAHYLMNKWLEIFGLTADDVNFVNMEYPQAMQAFEAGEGDIVGMQLPTLITGKEKGYVSVGDPGVIAPQYENIICSSDAYENKRELVEKWVTLIYRANEAFLEDSELAAEYLTKWYNKMGYNADESAIKGEIEMRALITLEEAAEIPVGMSLEDSAAFMESLGLVEPEVIDVVKGNVKTDILGDICKEAGIPYNQ